MRTSYTNGVGRPRARRALAWLLGESGAPAPVDAGFVALPLAVASTLPSAVGGDSCRGPPWCYQHRRALAAVGGGDALPGWRLVTMIRIDAVWLATAPIDMRAGTETALARVVQVFGAAHPHHAYVFANRRANRLKVLVHDGIGIWLCARRLHQGRFAWVGACREGGCRSPKSNCAGW